MVDRRQVMSFRFRAQQLDRARGGLDDTAILDIGVQDTGPDGARWALALRGVDVAALPAEALLLLWTVRGAPHLYRRSDAGAVAAAVEPYSDADAGKRIYDAAKPLKAAGIGNLAALDEVASRMRAIVTRPTVKGRSRAAWPRRCPSRTCDRAGPARPPTCTRCRSGSPPCGPGWNCGSAPHRRCWNASPGSGRRRPRTTGST
ncbi:hypothetical protein JD77_01059 [Micromonospora olivasterospora]|uniref:Winged helix DNA-binding protein n=1 Tax=Micromonospora olivasterospora TaxID=1880 RepID=A0A562I522_MICOL|nr:hypothetical protein JD77_01059 [Micromonospora olivasterospora]